MAFDEVSGLTVLFGGDNYQGENQILSDTWTWDGTDWTAVETATAPERRFGAALGFDPVRDALVLFGGHAANFKYFNDTWTWTKGNWEPVNVGSVGPSPRGETADAYDVKDAQFVVFGGVVRNEDAGPGAHGLPNGETWILDHEAWSQRSLAQSPSRRFAAASAYDDLRGRFLLFGGVTCPKLTNELWAWDGQAWSLYDPATRPSPRYGAAMAFDRVSGRVLLFGGSTATCL